VFPWGRWVSNRAIQNCLPIGLGILSRPRRSTAPLSPTFLVFSNFLSSKVPPRLPLLDPGRKLPWLLYSGPSWFALEMRDENHAAYVLSEDSKNIGGVTIDFRRCSLYFLHCSMCTLEFCAMRCCPLLFLEVPGAAYAFPVFASLHTSSLSFISSFFLLS